MTLSNKVWYFAYGSNLNVDQMSTRVGEWHLSKRALARNYKLAFNVNSTRWQGNAANLQPSDRFDDVVYGVVYLLNEDQLKSLAKKEGVEAVTVAVELEDGNEIPHAKTFIWKTTGAGTAPSELYRRTMEEGLLEHGYKKAIVDKIFGNAVRR